MYAKVMQRWLLISNCINILKSKKDEDFQRKQSKVFDAFFGHVPDCLYLWAKCSCCPK